ncbi:UDP-N-acetyl-D-galactosamine dehydrogenase [Spirosomataceae bacterium TFI 002]|nr:UDP-N-acetyl-D-galactosamine dehydrogenase [Spirosomataceae bacterium TFI 002]
MKSDFEIVIIGLGYVGLGLAIEFGKTNSTLGIDTNKNRVLALKRFQDQNGEINKTQIKSATKLKLDYVLKPNPTQKRYYIITVPTPVDEFKNPDLSFLLKASEDVGNSLQKGDTVIYESTTYPTCTRDFCIPILEKVSHLTIDIDFGVGFCPERVNPGQNSKPLKDIVRVISASNTTTLNQIKKLYLSIGQVSHKVSSFEVAEMSKLAENSQRDLNISFVNEIALICDKLEIKTKEVLDAAQTKWNFHNYTPGLVGGHCISVDPYYLIYKSESIGYFPKVIGAGREVNEHMPAFIAAKCVKLMIQKNIPIKGSKALILGVTFKENCSDTRNSKVFNLINELKDYGLKTQIYDPYTEGGFPDISQFEAIICAVSHEEFKTLDFSKRKKDSILFDIKGVLKNILIDSSL